MGSSGSGKTLFAIRRIPELLFQTDEANYFRLHFIADQATNLMMKTNNNSRRKKILDFPKAVAAVVDNMVGELLTDKGLDDVKFLNIPLHITIDEAGGEANKEYFDTAEKIESIVTAVRKGAKFKFQQEIHVTVVGTRLETSTADIFTPKETTKFRMQAWTAENFDALVDKSSHPLKNRVKQVVHAFPVLEDLTSNARCAFYVLESMENVSLLRENRVKSSVPVIVSSVTDSYIANNGLDDIITQPKEKWQVARSVFRALDFSTRNRDLAFFPRFEDLETEQLRSVAASLLDVDVESKLGVPELVMGRHFAICMTPAIAIVVANLLSTDAKISWDWQGFETTAMLSEIKRMIVNSKDVPSHTEKLFLQLQSPLPAAARTRTSVLIPVLDKYTVVLNARNSQYADVIAPYRLVQARFSKDNGKPLNLDLQNELDKMGLTRSPKHALQQYITSVFQTFWEKGQETPSWLDAESISQMVNKDYRFECYPFNTLNKKVIFEDPKQVQGRFVDKKWVLNKDTVKKGVDLLTTFGANQPVMAVFVTNCPEFRFKIKREKNDESKTTEYTENITITPKDVDWEGNVREEGDIFSKLGLLENVKVRFLFF